MHRSPRDCSGECERWVLVVEDGVAVCLLQEFETRHAHRSGESYVRPGKLIPVEEFCGANSMPDNVRRKLYKFLGDHSELPLDS